jgi:hypothetical protein
MAPQLSPGTLRSSEAEDVSTPLPEGDAVLLTEEEQRLMYLFPRVPFPENHLNSLQLTYLDQVIDWGWYVLGNDLMYAPTATFLAKFHTTHAHRIAAMLSDEGRDGPHAKA